MGEPYAMISTKKVFTFRSSSSPEKVYTTLLLTGKPHLICRGTRDIQLSTFYALGVIEAPTDEAWNNALTKLNAR
jgi:hypothetical protein